jgi:hypothetical protein
MVPLETAVLSLNQQPLERSIQSQPNMKRGAPHIAWFAVLEYVVQNMVIIERQNVLHLAIAETRFAKSYARKSNSTPLLAKLHLDAFQDVVDEVWHR